MTSSISYSIGWIWLAGMAAFLSPCTVPILPGYVSYLAARCAGCEPGTVRKWPVFLHGVAFVLGFSLLFILLGATASLLGRWLLLYRQWITRLGGVLMIVLGLYLAGILRLPFLDREWRAHWQPAPRFGYLSSFLMGIAYSAGWTPCIGPILTSVLMLAAFDASLWQGMALLAVFAFGFALPFLVLALLFDRLGIWLTRLARISRWVSLVTGLILVFIGILFATDHLSWLAGWLPGWDFGL